MLNKNNLKSNQAVHSIEKPESQLKEMWDSLKDSKSAMVGLIIVLFLAFLFYFLKRKTPKFV